MLSIISWFALIFALGGLIKLITIFISPKSWMNFAVSLWKKPTLLGIISFILALVVLYYLLMELTIIQIFAVMLFVALLMAVSVSMFAKDFISFAKKIGRRKRKQMWWAILIWLVLIIWVLVAIF